MPLGSQAITKDKNSIMNYELLLSSVFSCFHGLFLHYSVRAKKLLNVKVGKILKKFVKYFFFGQLIRCNEFKRFFSKYLILDLNKLIRFLISIAKFDLKNSAIFFAMHKKMHLMSSEGVLLKVDFTLHEK